MLTLLGAESLKGSADMNVETKRFLPLVTQYIYVDAINRRGRRVTMIMLSVALALLCALFAWFSARRLHVLLVDQADRQFQARQYQIAAQRYGQALLFDSADTRALLNRGLARQNLADHTSAIADFTRYIGLWPDDAAGYLARGRSNLQLDQADAALSDFGAAITRDPADPAGYVGRGRAYTALRQWQPAMADLDHALQLHPTDREALAARAAVREQNGDFVGALGDLNRGIELDRQSATLYVQRGAYYERRGDAPR